jgi:2-oxoglutarate/2-oxoacid ferredoxin oxidoreductase subunit alpha
MTPATCNILIGGEAGQGLVTVGSLLAKVLVRQGFHIVVTQDYQSRIRGGHNTFAIRVSTQPIAAPQERVDLLVALNAETIALHRERLSPSGTIVADESFAGAEGACLAVPFKQIDGGRQVNIVALGVAASLLGLSRERCAEAVHAAFGKKDPKVAEENERALANAFEWAAGKRAPCECLASPAGAPKRLLMNGNDAIALGALSAGIKFHAFYPMTPSTSIALTLAAHAKRMGIVVEQAEDEIAAINMAIGASYAGAPSMVSTAGGGFALMVEGVSLAGMTETPVVIVVGQRPAPATGLPTRTEQGDLEFVLHAGHGEFPRALFAPGDVEECFHLTRRAFELAERTQSPVFLLTDQFLADSDRAVLPFDLSKAAPIAVGADPGRVAAPYRRFALAPDGVSPRLLPGQSAHLVVVDSDEHTEDGHITEDLGVRKAMVEKRLAKMAILRREAVPPSFEGDDAPDVLLVSWGSTKGAALEAAAGLRASGRKAGTLHFSQLWPLEPSQFLDRLRRAKEVVGVESNATAQFARLLRRETGFEIRRTLLRYDGLPITPEWIVERLNGN